MYAAQLQAALASIHHRWEHAHDGLTPGCTLCADEQAEVQALTAVDKRGKPGLTETTRTAPPIR